MHPTPETCVYKLPSVLLTKTSLRLGHWLKVVVMTCHGSVKSFNDAKGWGFITFEDTDVFLHVKDCVGGRPQAGDLVNFDIEEDPVRGGQMKAKNVTGGSGTDERKGKGYGGTCDFHTLRRNVS